MRNRQNSLKEKQFRSKLDTVKGISELKEVYKNVEQQNTALREDILSLRYKVDLLVEKQKVKNSFISKEDECKDRQIKMVQNQLKQQYKIMQELKKRREQSLSGQGTEELNEQIFNLNNKIRTVESELATVKLDISDFKRESQSLQVTLSNQEVEDKRNEPKVNSYSSENNLLKKKILSLRKLSNEKEFQSAKVMNSMYSIKSKVNKNEQFQKEIENKKLALTQQKTHKSKSESVDINSLKMEVESLKQKKERRDQEMTKTELLPLRRKDQLIQQNRQEVSRQKELEEKRTRMQRELNKYKRIWEKYVEYKNNSKYLKQYIENQVQAGQFESEEEPLRRQFAGVLGGKVRFDDRLTLKHNRGSYMIGFIVYEIENNVTSKNNLVAIRIIYDDPEASANNQVPIPGHYLSKCKMNKYLLMEGDFIKLFKIKYQAADSHILKIEIRTNRNSRYEFGDKRLFHDLNSGENVYGFDISISQYPVCLFGSYNYARSHWHMESLGVQINDLPA